MKQTVSMKQIGTIFLGLSLVLGTAALFGRAPDPPNQEKTEPPKQEKKKVEKSKDEKSDYKGERKQDKSNSKQKNQKRKAEQPKAQ